MRLVLTEHAVARYQDRVKPWLDPADAEHEIHRLAANVEPVPEVEFLNGDEEFDCYVELAPGIALACVADSAQLTAVTCLIRTGQNQAERRSRRHEKRVRKQRARAQKRREQIARRLGQSKRGSDEWD